MVSGEEGGVTYAAGRAPARKVVALKQQQNVVREKQALESLRHPFIMRMVRTFADPRAVYMLGEFVPGGELFTLLGSCGGTLDQSAAAFYAGCVADALEAIHRRRFVYRDLKPENLMIGADGYLKMVDFGFCKRLASGETATYTLCGTPEYMAPEILQGRGYGFGVDWWALGVLVYEILAGFSPFADFETDGSTDAIVQNVLRSESTSRFPRT